MNFRKAITPFFTFSNVKALSMFGALAVLTVGFFSKSDLLLILGGGVYFAALTCGIIDLYKSAKEFNKFPESRIEKDNMISKLGRWIEGIIMIGGLFSLLDKDGSKGTKIAGYLIWFGAIGLYFLSGIVVQLVAKIPLEFTYGGWKPKRVKKTRKQR